MKSKKMKNIALFGIAAGLISTQQTAIEANEPSGINLEYVIAKPSCKAHGGCGGDFVAIRNRENIADNTANNPNNTVQPPASSQGNDGPGNFDTAPFSGGGDGGNDIDTAPFSNSGNGGANFDSAPFSNGSDDSDNDDFDSAPFGD